MIVVLLCSRSSSFACMLKCVTLCHTCTGHISNGGKHYRCRGIRSTCPGGSRSSSRSSSTVQDHVAARSDRPRFWGHRAQNAAGTHPTRIIECFPRLQLRLVSNCSGCHQALQRRRGRADPQASSDGRKLPESCHEPT